jgi:hypothetical protein
MGDTRERECVGRGDGTRCRRVGEIEVASGRWACEECHDHIGLDDLVPGRRLSDDSLTQPLGDPREAGHGTAA